MKHSNYVFVCADLHGRFDLLEKSLDVIYAKSEALNQDTFPHIVFLGDYVDRGPQSAEIIDLLIDLQQVNPNVICLMGNHERMMLDYLNDPKGNFYWLQNGGLETLESYGAAVNGNITSNPEKYIPKDHIKWLSELPLYHETKNQFFVHAGINPDRPLDNQKEKDLLWIRDYFLKTHSRPKTKHVVHGHTPHQYDYERNKALNRRTNLDSGSVWTNIQTIAIFDSDGKEDRPLEVITLEGSHDEITVKEIVMEYDNYGETD